MTRQILTRSASVIGCAFLIVAINSNGGCQGKDAGGRAFATPEEAAAALVSALQPRNEQELAAILGPDAQDIISSGDDVADGQAAEDFVNSYNERHRIVTQDDEATLVVGEDDWPLPIPLVQVDGAWRFDTEAGKSELLARRVGRNELSAIETCRAIVDAQREFATITARDAGEAFYAQKFASDPGKRNGLYWETKPGEPPSPLGPLVAEAVAEGYGGQSARAPDAGPRAYHGYHFRMLTAQGPSAPGGARSYLKDGRMTGGFAAVAWPVEYGNSGIMTFMVRDDGVVYQKDLGENTTDLVGAMHTFDPDQGWTVVR